MEIWIATANNGKLQEYKRLLERPGVQVFGAREIGTAFTFPPENGKSFEENARIKARALRSVKNEHWVLGEDSGLQVPAMDNLPGIHSARYAGDKASDSENNAKLLKMMKIRGIRDRVANFCCCLCVYSPEGKEYIFNGLLHGQIGQKVAGDVGFGYDPVFVPTGETKTLSELGLAYKNKVSHRAQAVRELLTLPEFARSSEVIQSN